MKDTIAELKRLMAEATPGPWAIDPGHTTVFVSLAEWPADYGPAWQDWALPDDNYAHFVGETCTNETPQDAALIVAMRNALPSLLASAEENARLRAAVDVYSKAIKDGARKSRLRAEGEGDATRSIYTRLAGTLDAIEGAARAALGAPK